VPYRGGASVLQDLIAGRLDYFCPLLALALPYIESGKIKAVAVLTANRSAILPTLATAREQGLSGIEVSTWHGLFLPKGTPTPIVEKLHDAAAAVIDNPVVRERLKKIGAEPVAPEQRSPEYLQKLVDSEIRKWAAVIKDAGLAGGMN
jgi:tripartite-type tricarboxylate transporter receptor subunit TctC